ncbi:hypothetical protein DFQ27_004865 [Actinomortierella ambigua]|uniref:Uncharacterized protein n=1 Tax=Actinomortierella ambigua TaxID=1343610 RepID=A0A9P6U2R6_9FUNG|nr:hypothetical protein DFQ27_004865 [Actinomortierella ambigua]
MWPIWRVLTINGLSRQLTLLKLVFHPNRRKQIPLFYLLTNEERPTLSAELAPYPRALYELPLPHLKHLFISNAQVSPSPPSWSPDQMLQLTTFRLESSVGASTLCDNPPAPDTVPEEMVAKVSRFALYKVRKPWMAFTHSLTRLEIVGEYRGSTMMPTMLHRFLCSEGARQLQELYLSGIEYYSPVLNPGPGHAVAIVVDSLVIDEALIPSKCQHKEPYKPENERCCCCCFCY